MAILMTYSDSNTRGGLSDRVRRGAELLDSVDPNWFQRVTTGESFSIHDSGRCVLAQAFGSYWDGLKQVQSRVDSPHMCPLTYGFAVSVAHDKEISALWRKEIHARYRASWDSEEASDAEYVAH